MADTQLTFDILVRDRGASRAANNVADSIDRINDRTRGLSNAFDQLGEGIEFVASRAGRMSGLLLGALIVLPSAAVAAAGAVNLALGGAIAGIGILAAAQSKKVRKAFKLIADDVVATMKTISAPIRDELLNIAVIVNNAFGQIVPSLSKAFKIIAPAITEIARGLAEGFVRIGPLLPGIAESFVKMADALAPQLPIIMESLATSLAEMAQVIAENPEAFVNLVNSLAKLVVIAIQLANALALVAPIFSLVTTSIGPLLLQATSLITLLGDLSGVARGVGEFFAGMGDSIVSAWNAVTAATTAAWNAITSAVSGKISELVGMMNSLPGWLRAALGGLGGLLFGAGAALIDGLIGGINSRLGVLRDTLFGVSAMIPGWKGPLSDDLRLLTPAGEAIMSGLMAGIRAEEGALKAMLSNVSDSVAAAMSRPAPEIMQARPMGAVGAAAPAPSFVTVRFLFDGADDGFKEAIRNIVRIDGHGDVRVAFE